MTLSEILTPDVCERLAGEASAIVAEHHRPRVLADVEARVRAMPTPALVALSESLYERVWAAFGDAHAQSPEAAFAYVDGLESDVWRVVSGELSERVNDLAEEFMSELWPALERGDVAALAELSARFQQLPAVAARWIFSFSLWRVHPDFAGIGWHFDHEPEELLTSALASRRREAAEREAA
jgi:hypothetical protein